MTRWQSPAHRDLDRARRSRHLVRLLRSTRYCEEQRGFVAGVGSRWVLLARVEDGGRPGGWVASRIEHVDQVRRDKSFEEDFARSLPTWPPTAPAGIDLARTRGVLTTLQAHGGLVAFEQEDRRADCEWVGRLVGVADRRAWLHEVDPRARWHDSPSGYRLRNITTVSVATPYLTALEAVLVQQGTPEPPSD